MVLHMDHYREHWLTLISFICLSDQILQASYIVSYIIPTPIPVLLAIPQQWEVQFSGRK